MPLNDRKIIQIILEECRQVQERCEGYREEVIEVISDIVEYERQHRVQPTNIQKKISDKCNAAARFLSEKQGQRPAAKESVG
jgi:hypothetical protein